MRASSLAKYLTAEYERGKGDGQFGTPPDPGMISSHPGVIWKYEGVRRHMYNKGWSDGKALRDAQWAKPMRVRGGGAA